MAIITSKIKIGVEYLEHIFLSYLIACLSVCGEEMDAREVGKELPFL